jgi:hypothetical protein
MDRQMDVLNDGQLTDELPHWLLLIMSCERLHAV